MRIKHRYPTMLPPRGHQSAYRLNQRRTERRAFFIQAALGFPLNTPLPTRCAHSPFATAQSALVEERGHSTRALPSRARSAVSRDIFCSAPPLGCGSVHVLGGSFARFCVSENARVPLRYSGQPLHRKIIASRSPNTPWFCLSNRFFASFNQAINRKSIYADFLATQKLTLRIATDAIANRNHVRFSYSLFSVFASWRQQSRIVISILERGCSPSLLCCCFSA